MLFDELGLSRLYYTKHILSIIILSYKIIIFGIKSCWSKINYVLSYFVEKNRKSIDKKLHFCYSIVPNKNGEVIRDEVDRNYKKNWWAGKNCASYRASEKTRDWATWPCRNLCWRGYDYFKKIRVGMYLLRRAQESDSA